MGFKPAPDTSYFLIAKNSNMPLGVRHNSGEVWAEIEQQTWNPDTPQPQQHFRFDPAPNYLFWIKPGGRDLYLEPLGSRQDQGRDDGTPIAQAIWDAGKPHQQFRLVPAGNGYYRIISQHTGKFLDVFGNTTAVGARLVQHSRTTTENQLFRLVAVPKKGLPLNTTSFQTYTNYGRMLVLGLAGIIPKVGGGLAGLIGFIWPSDNDQRFWQQMKNYVDVRVREMLQHQQLGILEGHLTGLIANLRLANDPNLPHPNRYVHLVAITTGTTDAAWHFTNQEYLESHRILSHLSAWGTLVLGAYAQIVRDYDLMHPNTPAEERARAKGVYKTKLQTSIREYTKTVEAARAKALKWRLEKIGTTYPYYAWDEGAGWRKRFSEIVRRGRNRGLIYDYSHVQQAQQARLAQVAEQFNADMDAVLAPTRLWRFLDPDVTDRPTQETIWRVVGPFPCRRTDETPEQLTGTISHLSISLIDGHFAGLAVRYTDGRRRVTGQEGGTVKNFQLQPDEYIINAYGLERNVHLVSLTFETNLGNVFSTGNPTDVREPSVYYDAIFEQVLLEFRAGLDDALSPRLTGFSNGGGGLCFHWEYSWQYDWTGNLSPAEPQLAEPARPFLTRAPHPQELTDEILAEAELEQDFTTREFAPGQW
ncbi:RICIN domain-containing protein [Hymenobacter pini]|uniref:RICIN domain-containing protein n=1 Tax=Hymenobacter pini TaxID=2880879 RepID=UPI001CF5F0F0|nr:RICIN domain-containing protein [Hymenobacter pini]MCA8829706.1 RICIN domain-containing protein [Hymenobacter pini]